MATGTAPLVLNILQMLLLAEPAVITAIHNLLSGTGTADDLTVLKGDVIEWQAIADKASAEIAKAAGLAPVAVVEAPAVPVGTEPQVPGASGAGPTS